MEIFKEEKQPWRYSVPKPLNFDDWTQEERVEWHRGRSEKESARYELLTAHGMGLDRREVEDRLIQVQDTIFRIGKLLELHQNKAFAANWHALKCKLASLWLLDKEQRQIKVKQFDRKTFKLKPEEAERLITIRQQKDTLLETGEEIELAILEVCSVYEVDADPMMLIERYMDAHSNKNNDGGLSGSSNGSGAKNGKVPTGRSPSRSEVRLRADVAGSNPVSSPVVDSERLLPGGGVSSWQEGIARN